MRLCSFALSILLATATTSAFAQAPGPAAPRAPQPQQPAPPPAVQPKPYKTVAVTMPEPVNDPSFEAFRKQLAEVVQKKDRAGLAKLVVAQGFFWYGAQGDKALKNKPGIDSLARAVGLGGKDGGWDMLAFYAEDNSLSESAEQKGAMCSPADPAFDGKALDELSQATGSDPGDWGFTVGKDIEVHATAQPASPVTEKLGTQLVWVIPDDAAEAGDNPLLKIVTPSGKIGYIPSEMVSPLGNDQICYRKDAAGAWKIAGYVGGQ